MRRATPGVQSCKEALQYCRVRHLVRVYHLELLQLLTGAVISCLHILPSLACIITSAVLLKTGICDIGDICACFSHFITGSGLLLLTHVVRCDTGDSQSRHLAAVPTLFWLLVIQAYPDWSPLCWLLSSSAGTDSCLLIPQVGGFGPIFPGCWGQLLLPSSLVSVRMGRRLAAFLCTQTGPLGFY